VKLKSFVSAAVLALSVAASAQTYTLKLKPVLGKTYTLLTSLSGGMAMSVTMSMKAIKETGSHVVLQCRITDMSMNGKSLMAQAPQLKSMLLTMTEDSSGHLVGTDVSGVDPKMVNAIKTQEGSGNFASFPTKPIKIGDSWAGEYTSNGQKLKATYKFASIGTDRGLKVANLVVNIQGSAAGATFNNPLKMSVELSTGMLVESSFSLTMGKQSEHVKLTRI